MSVSQQQILTSMAAFDASQPLDAGALPVSEQTAFELFASAVSQFTCSREFERASPRCREAVLVSSLTYALVEAALLREQLEAQRQAAETESKRLLARITAH